MEIIQLQNFENIKSTYSSERTIYKTALSLSSRDKEKVENYVFINVLNLSMNRIKNCKKLPMNYEKRGLQFENKHFISILRARSKGKFAPSRKCIKKW